MGRVGVAYVSDKPTTNVDRWDRGDPLTARKLNEVIDRVNKGVPPPGPVRRRKQTARTSGTGMFQVVSEGDNHIECHPYSEETGADTSETVRIAKPWFLRRTPFDGDDATWDDRGGWTHSYTTPSRRVRVDTDGFTQGQKVDPAYLGKNEALVVPGDLIFATANVDGGTGVSVNAEPLLYLDDNRDARRWVDFNFGVYLVAGHSENSQLTSRTRDVDSFVPDEGSDIGGGVWTTRGPIPETVSDERNAAAGFTLGDRGYLVGGATTASTYATETLVFARDTWTIASDTLNTGRHDHVGLSMGGKGYVLGGDDSTSTLTGSVEEFTLGVWSEKSPIQLIFTDGPSDGITEMAGFRTERSPENPRYDAFLCGGENDIGSQLDTIIKWNPAGGGSSVKCGSTLKPSGITRRFSAATAVGFKGYVMGGYNSGGGAGDYNYNTEVDTQQSVNVPTTVNRQPLNSIRQQASAFTVGGKVYIVGGWQAAGAVGLNLCEQFTPDGAGTWVVKKALPSPARFSMGVMNLIEGN